MAILGKIDTTPLAPVTVADEGGGVGVTVTGPGDFTDPLNANYIEAGDIIEIDNVPSVVYSVTNETTLVLKRAASAGAATTTARRTAPKEVADYMLAAGDSFTGELLCVSLAEAQDPGSRARGITGPGWWLYKTFVDVAGNTRHKAECIASFKISGGTAGVIGDDAFLNDTTTPEDTVVGQVDSVITPDPLTIPNVTAPVTYTGTLHTTGVVTSSDAAIINFQWQRRVPGGRFQNIDAASDGAIYDGAGANAPSGTVASGGIVALQITGATVAQDGYAYRVKLTTDTGAPEVVSGIGNLTVTPL